jgi:nucleoside phosphorylase
MGEHNIVIASLAAGVYGPTSAATTVSNLLSSLPEIRIGLLVGIGGGIARPDDGRDIRLGDVVVSQPDEATGGVVQYDLVKAKSDGTYERKGFLNIPPLVLLHALSGLQAAHESEEPMIPSILSKMLEDRPRMAQQNFGYIHQGLENDQLFQASCEHAGGLDCHGCDLEKEIRRKARDSTDPNIHYGIIASGNTLVKDAATRDKFAEHVGSKCLCVEMEAAGLMNHFPCLVIRGICDYADSHKNDRWQRYASATAAAFGRELLNYVPVRDLQEAPRAVELLQSS